MDGFIISFAALSISFLLSLSKGYCLSSLIIPYSYPSESILQVIGIKTKKLKDERESERMGTPSTKIQKEGEILGESSLGIISNQRKEKTKGNEKQIVSLLSN